VKGRGRLVPVVVSPADYADAERHAAARGLAVEEWLAQTISVALVDLRRAARDRSRTGSTPAPVGALEARRASAP
jgi:hypothetical protein